MIGSILYQLTPRDLQSHGLEIVARQINVDIAATTVFNRFNVPEDRSLWIQLLVGFFQPGGAAGLELGEAYLVNGRGQRVFISPRNTIAGQPIVLIPRPMLLGPGDAVEVRADFSSALASNRVQMNIMGISIPRGTLGISG